MRTPVVLLALLVVAALTAALVARGDDGYLVRADFAGVGGLREGSKVQIDGVPVGTVERITLAKDDRAVVEARIERSAAPIGAGGRATVRAANLLGEKYLDLERGDTRRPQRGKAVIAPDRTGVAVELDDVINALDLPTRAALQVVINESGTAMSGRGRHLGATLEALPNTLDRTGELLDQFATDNEALGRLVDASDRVVGAVARELGSLGRLVGASATTFETVAGRRRELGETVRRAPVTLSALRRTLSSLDGAAAPLGPAARGLRATAPQLTATLKELPPFLRDARPALRTAREVSGTLDQLGRQGAPLVRRVRPLARELKGFATGTAPFTAALDQGVHDVLGVLEGWARSTAPRDGASHVFRAGLTAGSDLFTGLLDGAALQQRRARRKREGTSAPRPTGRPVQPDLPRAPTLELPKLPKLPGLPDIKLPTLPKLDPPASTDDITPLLDFLLGQ